MAYEVSEVSDVAPILPLLEGDRRWTAYALSDLERPYRQNARILAASSQGEPRALLLLYTFAATTAMLPFGEDAGIEAILRQTRDLPATPFLVVRSECLPVLSSRYRITDTWKMWRMAVDADTLIVAPAVDFPVVRLGERDIGAIRTLYHHLSGTFFFDAMMLANGVFVGAFHGDALVAVAGTHVVSQRHRLAAIGGVFTHPGYRGRGLATATTGAVAAALVVQGLDPVVLNVRANNAPALAAYRRLGFREWLHYLEGHATLRGTDPSL